MLQLPTMIINIGQFPMKLRQGSSPYLALLLDEEVGLPMPCSSLHILMEILCLARLNIVSSTLSIPATCLLN